MNVKGIIVEQIDWDGTSKTLTMQPDYRLGDLWVAFPNEYDEPREGPFYFQNPNYEKSYNKNIAECKKRKIAVENFYSVGETHTFKTIWHNIPTERESLTYYALYLPEYGIPTNVDIFDPNDSKRKFKRTVLKDNQKPRYIIYLRCSSKFGKFNFNLFCDFKKDIEGFDKSTYSDEYLTDLYSDPEHWQNFMEQGDKQKTQKFFAEQIVINKGKFNQNYKPKQTNTKKKFKLEFIHWFTIVSAVCAVIVLLFGNNIWGRLSKKQNVIEPDTTQISNNIRTNKIDTVFYNQELPYLENFPIIDKGLFVNYYFNNFIFGGVNIDTISINARTSLGETLKISKGDDEVSMDITQEPYIEFEYKGKIYSIEVSGKHHYFTFTLLGNIETTLKLNKYKEL